MRIPHRFANWLETRWVAPSYSGWLLFSLSIFFFIAGTNTLSGWLYVISGIGLALLAIAAFFPRRVLHQITVRRTPIHPVSAGDTLTSEVVIENLSKQPKSLLQIQDHLPASLGKPAVKSIETIAPRSTFHWVSCHATPRRGIYRWQTVYLRTGAPLGLFWSRQTHTVRAMAIVYPTVLPLTHCPLIDDIGRDEAPLSISDRRAQAATEGLTRSLRPYRWGDPIRLVHWRTSARYGELRIRELEQFIGGQDLLICLDSASPWQQDGQASTAAPRSPSQNAATHQSAGFEQAVIAAASLYFYGCQRTLNVKLWTAGTGLIQGNSVVLETLAGIQPGETVHADSLPSTPIVWLTQNRASLTALPIGSRWLLWESPHRQAQPDTTVPSTARCPGIVIHPDQSLAQRIQDPLDQNH